MRTREEIDTIIEESKGSLYFEDILYLELLLDIRDLLDKLNKSR